MKTMSPEEHKISRENFWSKNDRLKRPMSPHLTIYKMQMTSVLSITHRMTGLALRHHVRVRPVGGCRQSEPRRSAGASPSAQPGTRPHHHSKVRHRLAIRLPPFQRSPASELGHGEGLPDDCL